jgi:DnaJ-class molecular chaperone
LRVEVKVVVPRQLNDRQRDLLQKLAADEDPKKTFQKPPPAKGWVDKVWDFIGSFSK